MTEELKREGGDANTFTRPLGELDTAHAVNLTHDRTIILCGMTNGYALRFHSTSKPDDRERFFQMALTPEGMQAVVFLYGLFGKHDRDAVAFWRELDEAERQSLQGSVEETHAQFNEENRGDLVVSLLQLVARWLGGDARPDTIARTFDAGQTVRLDFGASHLESLAAEIQKITYVGAPGQRVGDNVRLAVPVQTVRDFVAFAECACDVHGDTPGDCMVCRVTDALYIATGEECYHREGEAHPAVAIERLHPVEEQLNDPLRLARDDFEQKAGVSSATVEEHRQRAEVMLRRLLPGDRVTLNAAARDLVAFDPALAEDWRTRFDVQLYVDDSDVMLTKNDRRQPIAFSEIAEGATFFDASGAKWRKAGAWGVRELDGAQMPFKLDAVFYVLPAVTMTEVEGFATLDDAPQQVIAFDPATLDDGVPNVAQIIAADNRQLDASVYVAASRDLPPPSLTWGDMTLEQRVARNLLTIAGLARNLRPGDHLTLNALAVGGAGLGDLKLLAEFADEHRLHCDCTTMPNGFAVEFTKAEAEDTELRLDFDAKKKGGD